MKDIVSKVKSFVTFELPVQPAYVHAKFASLHKRYQTEDPQWSTAATRQKLISSYWLRLVPLHFAGILATALIIVSLADDLPVTTWLAAVLFAASFISYVVLSAFHYKPNFLYHYLPHLENAKEAYEGKQNEQLEKCRQAQLSNLSLSLLFFVFAQKNGIDILRNDDRISKLLTKVFGVDSGSIKKNLDLIITSTKVTKMTERRMTELQNRFIETYQFLDELGLEEAARFLAKIEVRLLQK